MKIVYCLNSIRYLGGIQRVTVTKANALADVPGNEVYVVVTDNKVGAIVQPLSPKVHLIDLEINHYEGDTERSTFGNLLVSFHKRRLHKKRLEEFLLNLRPDIVISVGTSEKYMLLSMKNRTWKVIREFHFERFYRKKYAVTRFDRLMASLADFYEFHFRIKKYDKIILLTHEDREDNWHNWTKTTVVPNPISFSCENPSSLDEKCVSMVGRLEPIKNCSSMIKAFRMVVNRHPDWTLKLYGDGSERGKLLQLISDLKLQDNVELMGYTSDVRTAFCEASIATLTSLSEGFALVIIEAMECGVPFVSYQCHCGPKDLIDEGVDGFLVPVNDEEAMADRICQLIEDEELRRAMGHAAKEKAQKYHIESITNQWMALFDDVLRGN